MNLGTFLREQFTSGSKERTATTGKSPLTGDQNEDGMVVDSDQGSNESSHTSVEDEMDDRTDHETGVSPNQNESLHFSNQNTTCDAS